MGDNWQKGDRVVAYGRTGTIAAVDAFGALITDTDGSVFAAGLQDLGNAPLFDPSLGEIADQAEAYDPSDTPTRNYLRVVRG